MCEFLESIYSIDWCIVIFIVINIYKFTLLNIPESPDLHCCVYFENLFLLKEFHERGQELWRMLSSAMWHCLFLVELHFVQHAEKRTPWHSPSWNCLTPQCRKCPKLRVVCVTVSNEGVLDTILHINWHLNFQWRSSRAMHGWVDWRCYYLTDGLYWYETRKGSGIYKVAYGT
jgi:hypothetical protein